MTFTICKIPKQSCQKIEKLNSFVGISHVKSSGTTESNVFCFGVSTPVCTMTCDRGQVVVGKLRVVDGKDIMSSMDDKSLGKLAIE